MRANLESLRKLQAFLNAQVRVESEAFIEYEREMHSRKFFVYGVRSSEPLNLIEAIFGNQRHVLICLPTAASPSHLFLEWGLFPNPGQHSGLPGKRSLSDQHLPANSLVSTTGLKSSPRVGSVPGAAR